MSSGHLIVSRLVVAAGSRGDPKAPPCHLDLEVGEGQCAALMGPGASALVRLLAGLCTPVRGSALLDGREVRGAAPDRVLVSPTLRPWFTAYRHVRRAVDPIFKGHRSDGERDAWTRHILRLAGLEHAMDLRPAKLSEGLRRRLALARALAQDPKIVLLDDPYAGLDADTREGLQDTFLAIHERLRHTVVFATDDLDEAVLLADQVVVLTGAVAARVSVDLMRPRVRIDLCRDARYLHYRDEAERLLRAPWTSQERRLPPCGSPRGSEVSDLADRRRQRRTPVGKCLESSELRLGFVPLTDCAPLAIANEEGFFAGYGLKVTLSRETSWQNIRDKVAMGLLDGAQMPAAIPLAAACDPGGPALVTALCLGLGGNGITVSTGLYDEMEETDTPGFATPLGRATALRRMVVANRRARKPRLVFAIVGPYSSHNYLLRYWMASAGIHPDRDVRLVVVPPPQMVNYLKAGLIAGYCVGEPWNAVAARAGIGRTVASSHDIWNHHPEKVFAVTRAWAEAHPNTHEALLKALLDACWWIEQADHEPRVLEVLCQGRYVNVPRDLIDTAPASSTPGGTAGPGRVWHRHAANFPWRSHAVWILTQMLRWGQITRPVHLERIATEVYRPDLYRVIAKARGVAAPCADFKREGEHAGSWVLEDSGLEMGPDRFMDGRVFDSQDPIGYLASFEVSELGVDLETLAVVNAEPADLTMGQVGRA